MFDGKEKVWHQNKEKLELQIISKLILGKDGYNAKYFVVAWAKLYRRSFIEKCKLYDVCKLRFKEDNVFNLYCFELANKIIYRNYCLYNYRQCENSLINTNKFNAIDLYLEYLEEEFNFIKKFDKNNIFYEAHYLKMIQSVFNIIERYMLKNKMGYIVQKRKLIEIVNIEDFKTALNNVDFKYLSPYLRLVVYLLRRENYWQVINIVKIAQVKKRTKKMKMYD